MHFRSLGLGLALLALPVIQGCASITTQLLLAPRPSAYVVEIAAVRSASVDEEGAVVLRIEGAGTHSQRRIVVPGPLTRDTVRLRRFEAVNEYALEVSREGEWVHIESLRASRETPWWGYALLPVAVPLALVVDACLIPVYLAGGLYYLLSENLSGP